MKAIVINDRCTGCGLCVDACPEVFEFDAEALARVKVDVVPAEAEAACRDAAGNCPVEAIEIEE
jgi:ferredoxin